MRTFDAEGVQERITPPPPVKDLHSSVIEFFNFDWDFEKWFKALKSFILVVEIYEKHCKIDFQKRNSRKPPSYKIPYHRYQALASLPIGKIALLLSSPIHIDFSCIVLHFTILSQVLFGFY